LSIVKSILDLHEAKYSVEMTGNILAITVKPETSQKKRSDVQSVDEGGRLQQRER
jgi:hypothetical protein